MIRLSTLDAYILRLSLGTLAAVTGIVMSLMVLEHLPRLIDITRLSGHRGAVIGQTVLGLLPEYAGIGMIFGLFLAIALTVRKLALRSELAAIEAMGISPWRWLRMPLLITAFAGLFVLLNQGWLMPDGERRIDEVGRRMAAGDFGYNLAANEFHDLGKGAVLRFADIDPDRGTLKSIFLRSSEGTFNAAAGTISLSSRHEGLLTLGNGQLIQPNGRELTFTRITVSLQSMGSGSTDPIILDPRFRQVSLDRLIASGSREQVRAACTRILWVALALLVPAIAVALGRPPLRSTSAMGIFVGATLIVALIKSIEWFSALQGSNPVIGAILLVCGWAGAMVALLSPRRDALILGLERAVRAVVDRITGAARALESGASADRVFVAP